MSEQEKEEGKGFKVVDRRRFTAEGELKADAAPDRPRPVTPPIAEPPRPAAPAKGGGKEPARQPQGQEPEIDFMSFVASLATNALAAMGALPEGRSHGMPVDPQMAREYIDIIGMLQHKTRGNLDQQEETAMQRLVTELKMHYVEFTKAMSQPPLSRR